MSEQPRKPAGSPNSTGGEYDFKTGAQDLPDTSLPVSYTHLTLPTKRIV